MNAPIFLSMLLMGCRDDSPTSNSPPRQSQPVRVELTGGEPPLPQLAEPTALQAILPVLAGLEGEVLFQTVGVLNLVPAPCAPCMDDSSIGVCLLSLPAGCENLPGLAQRAAALAVAGSETDAIRDAISYAEPWFSDATASQHDADVDVEVWVDPSAPGIDEILSRVDVLAAHERVQVHFRVMANDAADTAARGAVAAQQQGQLRQWLRDTSVLAELADDAAVQAKAQRLGLDMVQFQQDFASAQIAVDVMRSKGVRSSPTWFIEGYRLRGLQSSDALQRLVRMEMPSTNPGQPEQP